MDWRFCPKESVDRRYLNRWSECFREDFAGRCLPFDCAAALDYALIVAARKQAGRPISVEDAQIAAIARSADLTLATRNVKDFSHIDGLSVVNPWNE
ncbi:PIN domain-containing protein [Methylohalobius crimeensis]|uniref:hypothetical protein n=1 Tax=Methylohalobius crimeensis TaxID=244365 RepID=UPI0004167FFC|nr:hypothetical protein [Methylohalobius crimeensis]